MTEWIVKSLSALCRPLGTIKQVKPKLCMHLGDKGPTRPYNLFTVMIIHGYYVQCVWMHVFRMSAKEPGTPNEESLCQVHTCMPLPTSVPTHEGLTAHVHTCAGWQPTRNDHMHWTRYHSTGEHQSCAYVCVYVCLRKHYKLMQIFWPHIRTIMAVFHRVHTGVSS